MQATLILFLAAEATALGGAARPYSRISPLCRRLHGWDGVSPYDVLAPPSSTRRKKAAAPARPRPLAVRIPRPVKATPANTKPLQPTQSASARRHDPPMLLRTTASVPLLLRLVAMWVVAKLALLRLLLPARPQHPAAALQR